MQKRQEKAAETIRKYVADVQTLFRYLGGELCLTKRRLVEYKERSAIITHRQVLIP